eukprot:1138678-Pelagomonas_calceolata.AAC.4
MRAPHLPTAALGAASAAGPPAQRDHTADSSACVWHHRGLAPAGGPGGCGCAGASGGRAHQLPA